MTPSPVGMRCPDCATQSGKAVRLPVLSGQSDKPVVTLTLISLCVLGYLLSGGFPFGNGQSQLFYDGALARRRSAPAASTGGSSPPASSTPG